MGLHKDLGVGEQHIPYQWEYANAAAREAATGFVAGDIGKLAKQLDNNSLWMLTTITPTWIQVGSGVPVAPHAASHEGGADPVTPVGIGAEPAFSKNTAFNKDFGAAASMVCEGDDARLSDARTPVAHDLAGALHNSATLAELNAKISDATLATIATGNYTGNGTSQSIDVGWQPKIIKIFRWNNSFPQRAWKNEQMPGDDYMELDVGGLDIITANGITIIPTGFSVGSDTTINSNGNTYYWEACR